MTVAATAPPAQTEIIEAPDSGNQNTMVFGLLVVIILAVGIYFLMSKKTMPPIPAKPVTPATKTPIPGAKSAALGALTSPSFFSGLLGLGTSLAKIASPTGGGGSSGGGLPAYNAASAGLPTYNPGSTSGATYGPPSPTDSNTYGPPSPDDGGVESDPGPLVLANA